MGTKDDTYEDFTYKIEKQSFNLILEYRIKINIIRYKYSATKINWPTIEKPSMDYPKHFFKVFNIRTYMLITGSY